MLLTSGFIVALSHQSRSLLKSLFVNYVITADAFYGSLKTAAALLDLPVYFIFSCKGNYPFKTHTLKPMGKKPKKGAFTWTCGKEKLFEKPGNAGYKNGIPVPNFIATYRSTLGYVDQANAFRLRYRFRHRILKHTRAQFISIFVSSSVSS